FQCGSTACTRRAESTNRRGHPDRSQQGCAIPLRQGRQRCPQSTDSEGGSAEEDCATEEIRGAEVNFLSMPFGAYSSGIPPLRRRTFRLQPPKAPVSGECGFARGGTRIRCPLAVSPSPT